MTRRASPCWCGKPRSAPASRNWWRAPDGREANVAAAASRASLLAVADSWYVDAGWFRRARGKLVDAVRAFHRENPLAAGIAKQDLRAREMPRVPPFLMDALLAAAPEIAVEGETVRLRQPHRGAAGGRRAGARGHRTHLRSGGVGGARHGRGAGEIGRRNPARAPFAGDSVASEAAAAHQRRTGASLSAIERLRQILAPRKSQHFGVGEFKEWTGISRKYAIPLLEYLDREHITRREGDRRLIL